MTAGAPALTGMTVAVRSPAQLFASTVARLAEHRGAGDAARLHPDEAALVADATGKRRGEFAAGRECARAALDSLARSGAIAAGGTTASAAVEAPGAPIGRDDDGAPRWPAGVVGSISHSADRAICVVARADAVAGIGVDIEAVTASFPAGVLARIAGADECRGWRRLDPVEAALRAYALFSIKEAIYKCACSADGERLGFDDVRVGFDLGDGWFVAWRRGSGPTPVWTGAVGCDGSHVFSGLWRARAARPAVRQIVQEMHE